MNGFTKEQRIGLSRTTDTLWLSSKHSNKMLRVTHKYKIKLMLLVFSDCSVFVLLCVAGRGVLVEHKAWLAANTGGLLSPSPPSGTCSKKRKVANLRWNHLLLSTPLDDSVAEETSVHSWEEANSGETGATLPLPPFSFFPLLFYFFKNPCNAHLILDFFYWGSSLPRDCAKQTDSQRFPALLKWPRIRCNFT